MAEQKTKKTQKKTDDVVAEIDATAEENKPIIPKDVDQSQLIPVYNGFNGRLIYKSSRTGESFRWPEFGSEMDIELRELKSAKNTKKAFFENNWFMFDDDYKWVIEYLGVAQFYKHAIDIDEIDTVFEKKPDEIAKIISKLSSGQKNSVAYRARQLVADGTIDSRKVISTLEECLGIELIER